MTFVLLLAVNIVSAQRYTLHSATKGVTVSTGGKTVAAKVGMELKATDEFNIPEGGNAEVLNTMDNRIYRSVRPGKVTVTRLMIEARQSATDKLSTLSDKINVGRKGGDKRKRVYGEKGMVNRSVMVAGEEVQVAENDSVGVAVPTVCPGEHPEAGCCCPENVPDSCCAVTKEITEK